MTFRGAGQAKGCTKATSGAPPHGAPASLAARFADIVRRLPDAPAVEEPDRVLSYRELAERVAEIAGWLRRLAGPERIVAIHVGRGADLAACVLATWHTGAAYLALDPQLPRARLRSILRQVKPAAVVTEGAARIRFAGIDVPVLAVDRDLPSGLPPVDIGRPHAVEGDNLAYLIYTSGSTGAPKPVALTQRGLLAILDDWIRLYGLGGQITSVLQAAGFGFDVATGDMARALLTGCRLVMCPRETLLSPPDLHTYLRRTRPHLAEVTPSLVRPLVGYLVRTRQRLDFVHCVVVGGETWTAADQQVVRAVTGPRTRIVNTYGLTETTIDATYHETSDRAYEDTGMPIGRPFSPTQVHVLDAELGPAEEGELYVGGDTLARGYHADPGLTAARFVSDPFGPPGARLYRTGDRVRRLPDGDLLYLGRIDDQVKIRGVRIHLAEVETALTAHTGVRNAIVVPYEPVADGERRTELAAYVIPADADLDVEDLRRHAAGRLPPAMVPAYITVMDRFPVTPNGKIDRDRLAPPAALTAKPRDANRPADLEEAVADIWARVLGRAIPDAGANFFELGGNSLLAAQIVVLIREELKAEVSIGSLLRHPTVAELAIAVRPAADSATVPADPGRTEGPLSPGQSRLWLLDKVTGGLAAYNIAAVIGICGPLDVDALCTALRHLVDRHAVLRTAFVPSKERPVQRVVAVPDWDPMEIVSGQGDEWIRDFVRRPFDLTRPPLMRAALVTDSARNVLVLCMHHIVSDGWTLRILLDELGRSYSAIVHGKAPELQPLPVSYLDYSMWYANRLANGDFADQLTYWRAKLADAPAPPQLPRPTTPAGQGPVRLAVDLDRDLTDAVHGLAGEQRATPFMVLLAAFAALLRRWSIVEDLVVGMPFGARTIPDVQGVAGFFVNTIPLRLTLNHDTTFDEAVHLVRAAIADAARAQDVPFDLVQRELGRSGTSAPFRTWFNYLGAPDEPPELARLVTEMLTPPVAGALFDLNAYVTEYPDRFRLELIFDADTCDAAHMSAFLDQFTRLLRHVTTDPDVPFAAHPLAQEHATPVSRTAESGRPSLPALVAAAAQSRPDAIAVRSDDQAVTYDELTRWAGGISVRLAERGIGADDVVAVYGARDASLVAALLGVLEAGAAFTVLDSAYPAGRLAAQVEAARPRVLLHLGAAGQLPDELASLAPSLEVGPTPEPGPQAHGNARHGLAYVAFTSGTTGRPQAVHGDQAPVRHFLQIYARRFAIGPRDRFAMLSGLAHDPLLRDVFTPLATGGTLCVPPPELIRAPRELRRWLAAERITIAHLTPPLVRLLAGNSADNGLPDLRLAVSGGDQLRWADVAALRRLAPRITVVNAYGTTETPQVAAWNVISPDEPCGPAELPVPIGQGIDDVELLVTGTAGQPTAIGEVGRIVVHTRHLTRGHTGRYDTGDLGRLRPDGSVELIGRADDQVVVAGHRIELAEIDLRALRLPYIRDCVTRVRVMNGEPRLVSYVVPDGSATVELPELRADLRRDLPVYMLPSGLVVLDELPITPNGKVDRAALPEWTGQPPSEPGDATPRTLLERQITETLQETMRLRTAAADVSFFDLGATSLLMVHFQRRLERRLGREIPITLLFAHPTVRTLAAHLAERGTRYAVDPEPRRIAPPGDASRRRAIRRQLRNQVTASSPSEPFGPVAPHS